MVAFWRNGKHGEYYACTFKIGDESCPAEEREFLMEKALEIVEDTEERGWIKVNSFPKTIHYCMHKPYCSDGKAKDCFMAMSMLTSDHIRASGGYNGQADRAKGGP